MSNWSDLLPLVVETLRKRIPVVAEVAHRLLASYREAEWLPAERVLSEQLGVSRSTLREAVKRLEIQGLLEVRHGVGVRVIDQPHAPVGATLLRELPDADERMRQFSEARILLEPEIAARAAERITPAQILELRSVHDRLGGASDYDEAVDADLAFHRLLAALAGNRVLSLMLASIGSVEEESRRVTLQRVGLAQALAQHERVLEAVCRQDVEGARRAMLEHVTAARRELSNAVPSFPDSSP